MAILLMALALVPAGAHLFELPNKIGLAAENYFMVQQIYRGWALFGIVLLAALVANIAVAVLVRGQQTPSLLAAAAAAGVGLTLVVFFTWIFPANQATENWTVIPENWETLRRQWEYSHAANAVITFLSLAALTASVLMTHHGD